MIDFYSPQAYSHALTVRQGLAESPLMCKVDFGALRQVLLNLFINAQQAMDGGGELMIRTGRRGRCATVNTTRPAASSRSRISICWPGSGIAEGPFLAGGVLSAVSFLFATEHAQTVGEEVVSRFVPLRTTVLLRGTSHGQREQQGDQSNPSDPVSARSETPIGVLPARGSVPAHPVLRHRWPCWRSNCGVSTLTSPTTRGSSAISTI